MLVGRAVTSEETFRVTRSRFFTRIASRAKRAQDGLDEYMKREPMRGMPIKNLKSKNNTSLTFQDQRPT